MSEFEINKVPAATPDFQTLAAAQLAELFPEVVQDGKVSFEALQAILGDDLISGRGGEIRSFLAW